MSAMKLLAALSRRSRSARSRQTVGEASKLSRCPDLQVPRTRHPDRPSLRRGLHGVDEPPQGPADLAAQPPQKGTGPQQVQRYAQKPDPPGLPIVAQLLLRRQKSLPQQQCLLPPPAGERLAVQLAVGEAGAGEILVLPLGIARAAVGKAAEGDLVAAVQGHDLRRTRDAAVVPLADQEPAGRAVRVLPGEYRRGYVVAVERDAGQLPSGAERGKAGAGGVAQLPVPAVHGEGRGPSPQGPGHLGVGSGLQGRVRQQPVPVHRAVGCRQPCVPQAEYARRNGQQCQRKEQIRSGQKRKQAAGASSISQSYTPILAP
jgi:hypothetical protein